MCEHDRHGCSSHVQRHRFARIGIGHEQEEHGQHQRHQQGAKQCDRRLAEHHEVKPLQGRPANLCKGDQRNGKRPDDDRNGDGAGIENQPCADRNQHAQWNSECKDDAVCPGDDAE